MSLSTLIPLQSLAFIPTEYEGAAAAFLTHSRAQFNSSSIPTLISSKKLWDNLTKVRFGADNEEGHEQYWKLFMLSDTLQWTPAIYCSNMESQMLMNKLFEHLVKNTRYFCKSLKHLELESLTETSLTLICENIPALETLNIGARSEEEVFVTDEVMKKTIAKLIVQNNHLQTLDIGFNSLITDEAIKSMTNVEVSSDDTNNENKNNKNIKNKSLKHLTLAGCERLSNSSLENISNFFINITFLDLTQMSGITDDGITHLQHLVFLETLKMSFYDDAGETFGALSSLNFLTTLNLRNSTNISDKGAAAISSISSLKNLLMSFASKITDEGMKNFAKLKCLEKLSLSSSNPNLQDETFVELFSAFLEGGNNIQEIELRHCQGVKDGTLKCLGNLTKTLTVVHLTGCTKFSEKALLKLEKSSKKLNVISDFYYEDDW